MPSPPAGQHLLSTPLAPPARVRLLFNPVSGLADGEDRGARLAAAAAQWGAAPAPEETGPEDSGAAEARRASEAGVERLVVCGGDGTIRRVAGGLMGGDTILGIIPWGTGNLFAGNLGMPHDLSDAMRTALHGPPTRVDVALANGHPFLVMAGLGADARLIRDAPRELKARLGVLAYVLSAVRHLGRPPARYVLQVDGRVMRRRALTVIVANVGRIQGGFALVPGARADDGLLDVMILRAASPVAVLRHLWRRFVRRRKEDPLQEVIRCRRVTVVCEQPQPMQLDGDLFPETCRMEVSIAPGALAVAVPQPGWRHVPPLPTLPVPGGRRPEILAGAAASATTMVLCSALAARARRAGRRPGPLCRHPWLSGLAAAAGTALAVRVVCGARSDGSPPSLSRRPGSAPNPTPSLQEPDRK